MWAYRATEFPRGHADEHVGLRTGPQPSAPFVRVTRYLSDPPTNEVLLADGTWQEFEEFAVLPLESRLPMFWEKEEV